MSYLPSIVRYNSNEPASFDQIINHFMDEVWRSPSVKSRMRYDVYTDKQKYHLDIELPGIDKKDIELDVEGNVLKVKADFKEVEKQFFFIRKERLIGSVEQKFKLSSELNFNEIEAKYDNGLLRVSIPLKEEAVGRRISIS